VLETKEEILEKEALRVAEQKKQQSALESLESTQQAIKEKTTEQAELQSALKQADPSIRPEIQITLDSVNAEIKKLNQSFEQVAIGGVNLSVFGKEEPFDWQKELVLITQPILESLKGLTEKPRKIERLRTIIAERESQVFEIDRALKTIQNRLASQPTTLIAGKLKDTLATWEGYQKNNIREIELAEVQLESLLGNNVSWYETLNTTIAQFFKGRGQTLFIALVVSIIVWLLMKALLTLLMYRRKSKPQSTKKTTNKPRNLTSYRLAHYLYKLLTTVLIVFSVMIVLYVRGDLLLLALMIIVFIGFAVALKQILPRYVTEARLLLNLGTAREGERIIYNGIPWEIVHINVHTILRNPSLQGVLRIPLSELAGMNSRALNNDESWFPSKKGDYLLMPDGSVAEVLLQTPENVELQSRAGMRSSYPSQSFFSTAFFNLTKGESFGVGSTFGIDYNHLDISLTRVPEAFKQATTEGLRSAGLAEHVDDILVDFQTANNSSLDYIIYVTLKSRVASSYFKVGRVIQQSCVKACNENNWGIPFPQLTVHKQQ
jgi:small-conductance mechanosensitive channel